MSEPTNAAICAHCHGTGRAPTRAADDRKPAPKPYDIVLFVAQRYNVSRWQLVGRGRTAVIRRPRRIAMWLLRTVADLSFPEIGRIFNKADHSPCHVACKRVETERTENPAFKKETDELVAALCAHFPALPIGPRHPLAALIAAAQATPDDSDAADALNA